MIDATTIAVVLAGAWRRESELHGEAHWRCVAATGLTLADVVPGCDRELVLLFGLLHDTRRQNDHIDPGHGPRAAAFTRELGSAGVLTLEATRLELLCEAIDQHTRGLVSDDATTGTCWDADRLHLPRVWIDPDPDRFSTLPARQPETLESAATTRIDPPTWEALLSLVD